MSHYALPFGLKETFMTLDELEHTLPNGLHDAELLQINVDYTQRKLTLTLDVWVGDLDGPVGEREAYRKARIEIVGLLFFVIEPPDPNYPYGDSEPSRTDLCDMSKNLDERLLKALPGGSFLTSLWVNKWNAFAHIAAAAADLIWEDNAPSYRTRREHYLPGEMIDTQ